MGQGHSVQGRCAWKSMRNLLEQQCSGPLCMEDRAREGESGLLCCSKRSHEGRDTLDPTLPCSRSERLGRAVAFRAGRLRAQPKCSPVKKVPLRVLPIRPRRRAGQSRHKLLAVGWGGMVVSPPPEFQEKRRQLPWHRGPRTSFTHPSSFTHQAARCARGPLRHRAWSS